MVGTMSAISLRVVEMSARECRTACNTSLTIDPFGQHKQISPVASAELMS